MSKIKILSEKLANQIAAGEVVERPSSVVKEFVENAIDANATHIAIQIEGAGTRLIRVTDDGEGMDQDDVLLCLERHATSKLTDEQQLEAIQTLGFRGEAISSIASVSRLTITSRRAADTLGARAEVRFGKVMKVHEIGCGHGTTMEIRDLFDNVPARKKFLKSSKTEIFHIEEIVKNYGLVHPHIGVTYTVNGKDVFNWPRQVDTAEGRLNRILGRNAPQQVIAVDSVDDSSDVQDDLRVFGYLLPPDQSSGVSSRLRLFVNNRAIKDRMMSHAVSEGLQGFLMKGRRPAGALFVDIDPANVDVNVHPTKQEIRFRKSSTAHQFISRAVSQAMVRYQSQLKHSMFGSPGSHAQGDASQPNNTVYGNELKKGLKARIIAREPESLFASEASSRKIIPISSKSTSGISSASKEEILDTSLPEPFFGNERLAGGNESSIKQPDGGTLKTIGQVFDSFILCEGEHGLVVIDQHAAHERLLFEKLKKQFSKHGIARQSLLFSKVIEVNALEEDILKKYEQEISKLGIDIQEFGTNSFVIKAIPALMGGTQPEEIMVGIFEQFAGSGKEKKASTAKRFEDVLSSMACKAAIKAGHILELKEIEQLLLEMYEADIFSHCPHGRPVAKSFSMDDIKKWFHRT